MNRFTERISALRKRMGLTQSKFAAVLGLSTSYVHQLEAGKRTPSDSVETLISIFEKQLDAGIIPASVPERKLTREDPASRFNRRIPVVSWVHAGQAVSYEELPPEWQEEIVTDCRDEMAFALRLEGDSMEGKGATSFTEGDLLVVMPSERPYSGCYVACRFKDDGGALFRRLETVGSTIKLVPLNERYEITSHQEEEFAWIYPVWGRWSQLWKG